MVYLLSKYIDDFAIILQMIWVGKQFMNANEEQSDHCSYTISQSQPPPTTEDRSKITATRMEYSRSLNQLLLHIHKTQKESCILSSNSSGWNAFSPSLLDRYRWASVGKVNVRANRKRRVSDKVKKAYISS